MLPTPAEDRPLKRELPEPKDWLDRYGDALYRYALSRLRRRHDAEDAVQEAMLAALEARCQFKGRSHPRSWLLGILKHKVQGRLRAGARGRDRAGGGNLDAWFDARGKWRRPPGRWGGPLDQAERADFWRVVKRCLSKLPGRMAAAFTLRTLDDLPAEEVCQELDLSSANFWVLLHRARLRLVSCLQVNWFDSEEG